MARPTLNLSPKDIRQIEEMAGLGLTVEHMSAILGISHDTFTRRMNDTPGAAEALERGRAKATQAVMQTAYTMAVSGNVPAMTMFWLKCRARWREVQPVEVSGPDGKPVETTNLTDAELDARLKKLREKDGAK